MLEKIVYTSDAYASLPEYAKKTARDLQKYRYALRNFVVNTIRMRYRRSILGVFWSVLNPLLLMSTMVIAFSFVLKMDIKDFGIYVFSGLVPWNFITASSTYGSTSIISSENWLKKIYIPKLLFPIASVSTESVTHFFSIISLFVISLVVGHPVGWAYLYLPILIIILYIFCVSLAVVFGIFSVYFRDIIHLIQVGFAALFYLNPIVYPLDMLPPFAQKLMWFNPFFHYINLYRKVLYDAVSPSFVEFLIPATISLLALLFALFVTMKTDKDMIFRL